MAINVSVNAFVQGKGCCTIDKLSKIFLICSWALGLNRLALLRPPRSLIFILLFLYDLTLNCFILTVTVIYDRPNLIQVIIFSKVTQYLLCVILGLIFLKRLQSFYLELNAFDAKIGCKPKISLGSIKVVLQMGIVIIFSIVVSVLHFKFQEMVPSIPIHLIQAVEMHYYGYLIKLLKLRLRIINSSVESSLCSLKTRPKKYFIIKYNYRNHLSIEMHKLLNLYRTLVKAHDLLQNAIKWQLLVIVTTSFLFILALNYQVAIGIIRHNLSQESIMSDLGLTIAEFISLFAPCLCCDQLRSEVKLLRELLVAKLYEGKLDKASRCAARTLLALTKTRDLSFKLLRTLHVSISLPGKFFVLLFTYLTILLQFRKIINPPH